LLARFAENPYSPPDMAEAAAQIGEPLLEALLATGALIQVSPQVLFSAQAYQEMSAWVREHITGQGSLTLAQFRDNFGTSRKYAAAFLEHLDTLGITLRKGDIRVLKQVK
jgi:selenocysteine-specific elongation factor